MHTLTLLLSWFLVVPQFIADEKPFEPFAHGEAIELDSAIPANERGILALAVDKEGTIYGGTTGRAAHFFRYDVKKNEVASLLRLDGGIGFSYGLIRLDDGSFIAGTQADPTGVAVTTDPKAVGRLYRITVAAGTARAEDLGVAVEGQGIYTIAYLPQSKEIVGNTWPDGHFFTYDLRAKKFKDHGAIAGWRPFESPAEVADLNRGAERKIAFPRVVSRAILVDGKWGFALTAGAKGQLFAYDAEKKTLHKTDAFLPTSPGREPWTSLAATVNASTGMVVNITLGVTSEGNMFQFAGPRFIDNNIISLRLKSVGKTAFPCDAACLVSPGGRTTPTVLGILGGSDRTPRTIRIDVRTGFGGMGLGMGLGGGEWFCEFDVQSGGIPSVGIEKSLSTFPAMVVHRSEQDEFNYTLYAGESDRIGRLIRFAARPPEKPKPPSPKDQRSEPAAELQGDPPRKLDCRVVFAPEGTTTDGSGYTAIEVGKDGMVYVGSARYGDYAWLLRFDPEKQPLFMDKLVNMKQLTGERQSGINTQGKIHAKLVVGADGKIWFASKQGHEIFDSRPEYEDPDGYPGGHLCYYDPKTGFSRSVGILKKREGLMGGAIDRKRGKLYYKSEPKNHFLIYDIESGAVRDCGPVGAAGRYMAIDKHGAVYTIGRGNHLCRYDPETGYVEDLRVKVEGKGGYHAPYVIQLGPNGKLYGLAAGHDGVMEFDIDQVKPGPFPEVTMRNVAPAAPEGMPVQDIHAAVFGQDGRLYYPLNTTGVVEKRGKPVAHLRIMRFDPATGKCETLGIPNVVGLDESKVKHAYARDARHQLDYMQGAAVGPDGTLYLMDIHPQLNVAVFPKLTAPPRKDEQPIP